MVTEIFEKEVERVRYEKVNQSNEKLKKLVDRQTEAKSPLAYARAQLQIIKNLKQGYTYHEAVKIWEDLVKRLSDYETSVKVRLEIWKGKSGIVQLLKYPDKIIVIRMQKFDKDKEPKEVRTELLKEEINAVIEALNLLRANQPIPTDKIAMFYSQRLKMGHTDWGRFFCDRAAHQKLVTCLDVLDEEGLIHYARTGLTTILKKEKLEVQMVLNGDY